MLFILDIVLVCAAIGMALTYLYFLHYIRKWNPKRSYDNFFVLNFIGVYKAYLEASRNIGKSVPIILYIHLSLVAVTLVLGYFLQGKI
jgi:hypothetical protein